MEKIEKQINKLINEIEECAGTFEKLKNEYNVTYVKESDYEESALKLRLTSVVEAPPEYDLLKDYAYENFDDEDELNRELERIESEFVEKDKNKIQRFKEHNVLNEKEDYVHSYTCKTTELLFSTFKKLKEQAKFLITLVDNNKQKELTRRVDAIEIEKIQAKKFITVKEFTEIYDRSSEWQRNRRNKIHNRLPFRQEKKGGKVLYEIEEVEIWFKNNS